MYVAEQLEYFAQKASFIISAITNKKIFNNIAKSAKLTIYVTNYSLLKYKQ